LRKCIQKLEKKNENIKHAIYIKLTVIIVKKRPMENKEICICLHPADIVVIQVKLDQTDCAAVCVYTIYEKH